MMAPDNDRYLLESLKRIELKLDALTEKQSIINERLATLEQWRQHATVMMQMQTQAVEHHCKRDERMHEELELRIEPLEKTRTQVLFGVSLLSMVGGAMASILVFLIRHLMER